jgi:enoyl-CoA hydratase
MPQKGDAFQYTSPGFRPNPQPQTPNPLGLPMKPGLAIGQIGHLAWNVGAHQAIHLGEEQLALGQPGATVFSTPFMVMLMERAAKAALKPYLEPGEESVGVLVNIEHLAGTPIGANVRAEGRVTHINERFVDFDVAAYDDLEMIGRGTHRRAVVKLDKMRERLTQKIARLPAATGVLLPMNAKPDAGPLPTFASLAMEVDGATMSVTLSRAKQLNAIDAAMTGELEKLFAWLAGHAEVRVVILTGAGRAFSAGNDVKELASLDADAATVLSLRQARMWLTIETLPQVFIAVVNGEAMGGGCVATYSCDFRIAASAATFGMPEVLLGWPPGFGVAQLTALIGKARALDLCLTGKTITAQQALDFGLVHRVVPSGQLIRAAEDLAKQLLATPAEALRKTKQVIHADEGSQPKIAHLNDTAAYIRCLETGDAKEGIAAFNEKRKPRFKGK